MPFLGTAGIGGLIAFLKKGALPSAVTGGVLSEDSTYFYRTFKGSSTLTVTGGILNADVLVAAGGGGGGLRGSRGSGGGGAGGLLAFTAQSLTPTSYPVVVGAGGAGGTVGNGYGGQSASRGGDSQFGTLTLVNGGGGGEFNSLTTGSQGGSSVDYGAAINWTPTQGNAGGTATTPNWGGGGGGGKGAAGANASGTYSGGNGGAGVNTYSAWATATGTGSGGYYAGGGGGGSYSTSGTPGTGGLGGGANGSTGAPGNAGTIYTGGGGGGIYTTVDTSAGAGGSGVVIVRYLKTAVQASTSAYELIGTVALSAAQASVTFTNFPASQYKHLQLRITARTVEAATASSFVMQFNGDTGNNYSWHHLRGNGSSVLTGQNSATNVMYPGAINGGSATANAFSGKIIDILDFSSPVKNTTIKAYGGEPGSSEIGLYSGAWYNTAPVTSILIYASANFAAGCRMSLYGVRG